MWLCIIICLHSHSLFGTVPEPFRWLLPTDYICVLYRLHYTEACIHEALRMSSLTPIGIHHMTSADIQMEGYTIPKVRKDFCLCSVMTLMLCRAKGKTNQLFMSLLKADSGVFYILPLTFLPKPWQDNKGS